MIKNFKVLLKRRSPHHFNCEIHCDFLKAEFDRDSIQASVTLWVHIFQP